MSRRNKWLIASLLLIAASVTTVVIVTGDPQEESPPPAERPVSSAPRPSVHRLPAAVRPEPAAAVAMPVPPPATPSTPVVPPEVKAAEKATLRGHIGPTDVPALRLAARRDPMNHQRWLDLASALNQQGKYELAAKSLRRALKVGGEFPGRRSIERLLRDYDLNGPTRARGEAAAARTAKPEPVAKPDPKKKPYR